MNRKEFKARYNTIIEAICDNYQYTYPDGPSRLDMASAAEVFCNACFHGCIPDGEEHDVKEMLCVTATGERDYTDPYIRTKADRYYGAFHAAYMALEDVAVKDK